MIKINWKNLECQLDSEEVATIEEAKEFINDCLLVDPIVIDSVKIIDGDNEYSLKLAEDITVNNGPVDVMWLDHDGKSDRETLTHSADALRFVKEFLFGQPVIFNSIKIGEQSLSLTM